MCRVKSEKNEKRKHFGNRFSLFWTSTCKSRLKTVLSDFESLTGLSNNELEVMKKIFLLTVAFKWVKYAQKIGSSLRAQEVLYAEIFQWSSFGVIISITDIPCTQATFMWSVSSPLSDFQSSVSQRFEHFASGRIKDEKCLTNCPNIVAWTPSNPAINGRMCF